MTPEIATRSGVLYNFLEPNEDAISLSDIAHSLARQVRYNGQIEKFYTVAQHSIVVARLLPSVVGVHGVIHDASEAFVADIPAPLKRLIDGYGACERICQKTVYDALGLEYPSAEEYRLLEQADTAAGLAEAKLYFKEKPECVEERLKALDSLDVLHRALQLTEQIGEYLDPTEHVTGFLELERAYTNEFFTLLHIRREHVRQRVNT